MIGKYGASSGKLKKTAANIGWMMFDKVFILFLNLFVTVRVANYYGASVYGTYQYAVSLVALFEILVTFVDSRVVKNKYITDKPEEVVWNATVSRAMSSTLSLAAGLIFLLFCGESPTFRVIFLLLLFNAILGGLRFGMQNRFEYLLQSKKAVIASNLALTLGCLLQLLAVSLHLSIVVLAEIAIISSLVNLGIVYVLYRREHGRLSQGQIRADQICQLMRESLPLAIAASCSIIYSRCDSVMIGSMLSKADVGVYAIAVKLIHIVQIAISPVRESVYPGLVELYHRDRARYARRYVQITAILTWLYLVGVLASFAVLPYAFKFLREEYALAFPVYQIYVIGTFFMYNAGLRAGHYTMIKRGRILMLVQIISVVINLILNYTLIKAMGIYGAALATAVTQGISLFLSNAFFGKEGRQVLWWQIKGMNPLYIFRRVD